MSTISRRAEINQSSEVNDVEESDALSNTRGEAGTDFRKENARPVVSPINVREEKAEEEVVVPVKPKLLEIKKLKRSDIFQMLEQD